MSTISNAVSGLMASSRVMEVSAKNIANAQSTQYIPQQVVQTSNASGGVNTSLQDISPPSIPVFAPDESGMDGRSGIVQMPNANPVMDRVNQFQAMNAYKANLSVIKHENEMQKSTMDMIS